MKNIIVIGLSVLVAAAVISGLILYPRYRETKNVLLISEGRIIELNEKIVQMNQESSSLQNQILNMNKSLKELKSAKESIPRLESKTNKKDQTVFGFNEKTQKLEKAFEGENKANEVLRADLSSKEAMVTGLQEGLKSSRSNIRHLEDEIAKGSGDRRIIEEQVAKSKNEIKGLQIQLSDIKGQKKLAESKLDQMKTTYESLVSDLRKQVKNHEVTIKAFEEKITVTFVDHILFKLGNATITPKGRKILKKVGEGLKNVHDKQIRVEGHTDNIPIKLISQSRYPSNWELSAARAAAVIRHLQKKTGLDPRYLEAVGYSFYKPIASNETEEGRARNRRVNIIIAPKLE